MERCKLASHEIEGPGSRCEESVVTGVERVLRFSLVPSLSSVLSTQVRAVG